MTFIQAFALWFAAFVGAIPRVRLADLILAEAAVRHAQSSCRSESSEYRRHVALVSLTNAGVSARVASIAIESAVLKVK